MSNSTTPSKRAELALGVASDYVEAQVLQFQVLLKLRRYDEVIRACDNAIDEGKKSAVDLRVPRPSSAARNDYPGAIRDFSQALEIRPKDAHLLVHRGWAYLLLRLAQTGTGRLRSRRSSSIRKTPTL